MSIVRTFILQFYQNTLFMNKVGEFLLPSTVRMQYLCIIFNEKVCTILNGGGSFCYLEQKKENVNQGGGGRGGVLPMV
jgi:hypothetical protein